MHTPDFKGCKPASRQASAAARGASRKADTRCEVKLRKALWEAGARYRKNVNSLPGKPDIAFLGSKLAIFCDGDFWHGKDWELRKEKLAKGNNSSYWLAKIERNRERDRENTKNLERSGWVVIRFWESEIHDNVEDVKDKILTTLERLQGNNG